MSKLERIATFIMVVEENGFAAAARKQGISAAAVSKQISQLEKDLQTTLLQRTTRQIALTEIGIRYYQECKKALHDLAEAETAIAGSEDRVSGILTVISSRFFAVHHILPHLPEFVAKYPQLKLKLELAERFPNLAEEGIDLLFGTSLEGPEDLVRKRVAMTRYVVCGAPSYLAQYGTPQVPTDLCKHRYITHSMRRPDNIVHFKDDQKVCITPCLWLNDSRAMRECAIRGMGLIRLHHYVVADALLSGELVEVLAEYQRPEVPVYLYYQQSRYLNPKIRHFIDFYTKIHST